MQSVFEHIPGVRSSEEQCSDALVVCLTGGYGMLIDPLEPEHPHVVICQECVLSACQALSWLRQLLLPHIPDLLTEQAVQI